jgi:adenine deaminase
MSHPFRRTHRFGLLSVAPYDVLIRHGHILDGTGNPWYAGDIAIRGDRIAAIGSLEGAQAKRVIDASGSWSPPASSICWASRKTHC